ncbi:F-box protein [Dirofilaria immitis]
MNEITKSPGRYWPLSRKYDTVDRKYKFFDAPHAYQLETYYPLKKLGYASYSSPEISATSSKSQIAMGSEIDVDEFMADSNVKKETLITINDLPNDILLIIFGYCHPIDLIHCFSLVSHRWNCLANHPAFFTEVRILINDFSLKYGSVKTFFHRTSQYLRKLCINCSIRLPSAEVNALFDICFPYVIHLDISSFKKMNATLLRKLSNCFPNVQTLHMENMEWTSSCDDSKDEWVTLKTLFEEENVFPKMENFFLCDINCYTPENDPKLPLYKRPLNLLHIYEGTPYINFSNIITSPWRSTLTELHLGYYTIDGSLEYVGYLHNLKVFSWGLSLYTLDEEFAHLKNLCNLEELRVWFGGEDCSVSPEGLIALFTLPEKEPEKSFPFKLKHLVFANYFEGNVDLFKAIDRNCPNLTTLGLPYNEYFAFSDRVMPFIVTHFKRLVSLDLSHFGHCYKDEVWNNLKDDDLPNLRLLKLHGNKTNVENLRRLNLRRPKLLISYKRNYFINWTRSKNSCIFHNTFDGDIGTIVNDLSQIDGLRDFTISSSCLYDFDNYHMKHSSSVDLDEFATKCFNINHSV